MTGLETALLVVGTAVSAVGAISQGQAAKSAAKFNADVAKVNATQSRLQAGAAAESQDRQRRLRAGANRAALGGSGVTAEGSPLDVFADNARQEKLDELRILHAGEVSATGFEADAAIEKIRGKSAQRSGLFGAAGTLLGGGAKIAGL
ncbi:MAG: hypothetical protein V7745_07560 [Pseudomonadales bacterium]